MVFVEGKEGEVVALQIDRQPADPDPLDYGGGETVCQGQFLQPEISRTLHGVSHVVGVIRPPVHVL